ncbi:MAG TPA: hypothetical protein VGA85_01775 [Dehalococcoidales bacterium]
MKDAELTKEAKKLKAKAIFDHRYPLMYEESISMGMTTLIRYFAALQKRDLKGMTAQMHFPYASIEGTDVVVVDSAEDLIKKPPKSMDVKSLPKGAFDLFMGVESHTSDPVRAGLTMSYSCHGANGTKLMVCDGLYVVTNNSGRWGLQLASTIFTPTEWIGVQYPETRYMFAKHEHDWMEGWSYSDSQLLDSTRGLLGKSVTLYPNITANVKAIDHLYRNEGIVSRIRVNNIEKVQPGSYDFSEFRGRVAPHGIGAYSFSLTRHDDRVIHQSSNKAHVTTGYTRFQADGTIISTTWGLSVRVRRGLHWGGIAGIGNTIHYDASNNEQR